MVKTMNKGNGKKRVVQDVDGRLISKPRKCPECNSSNLVNNGDGLFCADCGLVINEQVIDLGPEWRAFDSKQKLKKARVGPPTTLRMSDLGLKTISPWKSSLFPIGRLRNAQRRTGSKWIQNTSFDYALSEIDRMSCLLGLPMDIREEIAGLYRRAMKKNLIKGKRVESIVAALLHIICRQRGIPLMLKEITEVSRSASQREILRRVHFLSKELNLKVPPAPAVSYVPRFCSELGLEGKISAEAIQIISSAIKKGLLVKSQDPKGIAAAAIYISAIFNGRHRTQKEIAEVADTTEPTIRGRFKELSEGLNLGIDLDVSSYAGRPKNNNILDKK